MMREPFVIGLIAPPGEGAAVAQALGLGGFEIHRITSETPRSIQPSAILLDLSSFVSASGHGMAALRQTAKTLAEQYRAPVVMIARPDVVPADVAVREEVRGHLSPAEVESGLAAILRAVFARHRDEERLRTKEAQIRNLLQETGHAFFSVDLLGVNLETSPTELAMLGYKHEHEIVGRSSLETHWLDPAAQADFMVEIMKHGKLTDYRMLFKKKGGRELAWTLGSCHIERDASGQAVKITGFYRDDTDAYTEFLYHAALSTIVRWVHRADDLPEVVCKTACAATVARVGLFLARDEGSGTLVVRYVTGLEDDAARRLVGATFSPGAFKLGATRGDESPLAALALDPREDVLFCPVGEPRESGSYVALLGHHTPVPGDARMVGLAAFLKNAADYLRTTVRLQIEGLYRAIQAALRGPNGGRISIDAILDRLLQALRHEVPFETGVIYRVVPAGAKARLQVAAAEGDRATRGRITGRGDSSTTPVQDFLALLHGQQGQNRGSRAPLDTSGFWSAVPIRALDGREVGLLYAATRSDTKQSHQPSFSRWDLEIFAAAADHAALVISLLEAEQQRSALLAHVTHEIRAPVNTIRSHVDMLWRHPHSIEQERRFKNLRLDGDVLLDLAHKLDGLFGSRRLPTRPTLTPIEPMLREIVENLEPELEERKISRSQIEIRLDVLLVVRMDRVHLWQVFFNLFENALKYAGPEKFSVRITGSLVGRFPIVRFRDRGIGVQAGDEERIFEAGERGSNIDGVQARGTGLGLFICRQHMAQYGGTITLATRFKPTEFVLSFPDPSLESL